MLLPGITTPLIVAHRGGAEMTGDDVFAGIDRAVAAGVPAVELDVRRTPDGLIVVHHGGRPGEEEFADLRRKEESGAIPSLRDVLSHVGGRLAVNLELKEAGYERDVIALSLQLLPPERLIVTSFLDDALRAVRRANPDIGTGLIVGRRPSPRRPWAIVSDVLPFRRLRASGADFLAPNHQLDVTGMRARAAARGIPLLVWTVNEPTKLAASLADHRLLGVVTDRFELTRK